MEISLQPRNRSSVVNSTSRRMETQQAPDPRLRQRGREQSSFVHLDGGEESGFRDSGRFRNLAFLGYELIPCPSGAEGESY